MIFIIKIILALILLGMAYPPLREAGRYRFRGQNALVFQGIIYVVCALMVLMLPKLFFIIGIIIGIIYFLSKKK